EEGVLIADVRTRRQAEAPDLGGAGVGEVVAVEVGGADHLVVAGTQQNLLEHRIGDAIVDQDFAGRKLAVVRGLGQLLFGDAVLAELLGGHLVAPVAEGAFGELLDVAFVHQGHDGAPLLDRVLDGLPHQALGAGNGNGLDAHAGVGAHLLAEFLGQQADELGGFGRALLELDAGVDVFGVFAEDDDVHRLGLFHRRGNAAVVLDRTDAGEQIHLLPQAHIEAADAAADRRGQRSLDGHAEIARGLHGVLGQPLAEAREGLLAGEHFIPGDLAAAAVAQRDGRVPNRLAAPPDVGTCAVAFDVGNDGVVGDLEAAILKPDDFAFGNCGSVVCAHASPRGRTTIVASRLRGTSQQIGVNLVQAGAGAVHKAGADLAARTAGRARQPIPGAFD